MRALVAACAGAGVDFVRAEVRRVRHDERRVLGVDTDGGPRDAAHVVIAAGAWSSQLDGVPLPRGAVTPVRGQMIELRAAGEPQRHVVRHVVFGAGGYLVPRADGRVLVGSTEERVGFVKEVTAAGLGALCTRVARLCPPLAALPVADRWSGPATRVRRRAAVHRRHRGARPVALRRPLPQRRAAGAAVGGDRRRARHGRRRTRRYDRALARARVTTVRGRTPCTSGGHGSAL